MILLYGGYQAIDGNIQVGILVAFVGYLNAFFDPIQQISQLYTTYQQGMAALDKIFDLLETQPDMVDRPDALDPGRLRGEIELDRRLVLLRRRQDWALDGRRPAHTRGADRGARRRDGGGEVDAREAGGALLRPAAGPAAGRRARPAGAELEGAAQPARDRARRRGSCSRARCGRTSPSGGPTRARRRFAPRRRRWARTRSSSGCATGTRPRSASAASACRPGSGSWSRSRGRCLAEPRILILDEATSNVDVRTERIIERGLERLLLGTHGDRDRAPAVDDQAGGADRGAGARPDRRGGHARGADRGRAARTRGCTAPGPSRRRRAAGSASA